MKKIFGLFIATTLVFALSLFTFAAVTPGKNLFTGDENPLTFDNLTAVPSYIGNATLVASPIEGDSGKVLLHTHSDTGIYATMPFVFSPALDCERPYLFEYKMYEKANNGLGSNRSLWVMKNSTAGWQRAWSGAGPVANSTSWRSYSHYLDNLGSLVNTNTNAVDKTAVSKIILEWVYDSAAEVGVNHFVYVDDVSFIPAYLVTYADEKGNTVRTEYVHPDNKSYAPTVSDSDAENDITGWSLTNGGKAVTSVTLENKDITLYAVYAEPEIDVVMPAQTVTPGINILTGTTEAYTFDNDKTLPSFITGAELVDSPYANESGKAIKHIAAGEQYGIINLLMSPALDCERGYQISFKMYYKSDAELANSKDSFWVLKNGVSKWQIADTGTNVLFNSENWYEYSHLFDNFGSLVNSNTNAVDKAAISKIVLEWTYEGVSGTNQFVYLDDISIVPAYYVAFVGEDGKAIKGSYMNLTGSSYAPTVLPDEKDLGIIGWSLENDGTVDERIPLENKDLILYAVYDNTLYFGLDASVNMLTSKGDTATITSDLQHRKGTDGISVSFSCEDAFVTLTDNGDGTATVVSASEGLAKIVCTASSGEKDEIYILSDYEEGKEVMKIVKSVSNIDTDAKSESVTAVLFTALEKDVKIRWKSNSDCVSINSTGNGIATITPVSNGSAVITAYVEGYEDICDSFTVTVSGQSGKQKVYELNVLVWGASLAKHPPAENLYWYGNWGMAASKEENDFIHRLVYYLEEKYYPSKVNLRILAESGFDTSINNDTSASTDYSENQYFLNMENAIKEHNPNIIVTIRTGNLSNDVPVDIAYNAYSQLYDMVYTHVPDAIVVAHHCLLHHDSMKEELYSRLDERYEDRIFEVHDLDVHSDESNLAREWLQLGQQAVANHWNDKGHDEVAKVTMNYLNKHIPSVLTPSFVYRPESITVSGKNTISEKGAAVQLYVTSLPENTSNSVIWTSSNEKIATVSKNGLVSAHNNGTVTITATSTFDESIYDEYTVTVTNQPAVYTLTYSENTEDTVSGMPEDDEYAKGEYTLSDIVPERECYTFIGWGLTDDAQRPVKKFKITENTTVYAIWKKTEGFEFEGTYTEDKGFSYGFDIDGGFHVEVKDSCLFTVCTSGEKVRFNSPKLDIQSKNFVSFSLSCGYFDENSKAELTVKTQNGEETYLFPILTDGFVTYTADVSALSGNITGFEIYVNSAPADASMFNIALDFVRFMPVYKMSDKDGNFVVTDGNTTVSSLANEGYLEIEGSQKALLVTLDSGYSVEVSDRDRIFVNADKNGTLISVNKLYYNASGKYGSADCLIYTKTADGIVESTDYSEKLTTYDNCSMRIIDPQGIRIRASVQNGFYENEDVLEYGFAVAREDSLTSGKIKDVTLDEAYISSGLVVYGKAYSKSENIHKVFESDDETELFVGVLTNIPKTKKALTAKLIFKPYIKLADGTVLYGARIETSALEVASSLYFSDTSDETTKNAAKEILDICGVGSNEIFLPLDSLWD